MLQLVDEFAHGLLNTEESAYVERRIAESEVWAAAHAEALRRKELIASVPASEPGESLIGQTLERVAAEGPTRERNRRLLLWTPLAGLAAAVAVFLGVNLYFASLRPPPYDLQVYGQSSLASDSRASLRVRLSRPGSGDGVAGVPVEITIRDPERSVTTRLASFTTDEDGTGEPSFLLPGWADGRYELSVSAATPQRVERIAQQVTLRRAWRVALSTDKPVYQPGQTIRMRTLAVNAASARPMAGQRAEFTVTDAGGNVIFREPSVTSRFGIASADCPLADLLIEGSYTVRCRVDQTESATAVEVKRYTLPAFRVGLTVGEPFYAPGGTITGTIDAAYYFGKPVAGGEATVTLVSDSPAHSEQARTILHLDQQGRGSFSLQLPHRLAGTPTDDGDAAIRLTALVRDSAGQEAGASARRLVTSRPLRVTLVPDGGALLPGRPNEVFAFVTTADGRPAAARLMIEGLDRELQTDDSGVTVFSLDAPGPEVAFTVRADDDAGRTTTETVTLRTEQGAGAFLLHTDAAAYDAGGTITASVVGIGDGPVFLDVLGEGQTVATGRIAVERGRGQTAIDLPPEATGALRLVAYRFDDAGFPLRRERTVVVRPATQLRVELTGADRPHRPGETAPLSFQLRDATGAPAPGALSLAIVDEAVFGVADDRSPTEQGVNTLASTLLEPIYAVYPWDPFDRSQDSLVSRAVGALSARETPVDRDEILSRLVEEGYLPDEFIEMLDELEPDRLEEILDQMRGTVSDTTLDLLRGERTAAYTLRESSYTAGLAATRQRQAAWRDTRAGILAVAGVVGGLALFIALLVLLARAIGGSVVGCLLVALILAILVGVMLPSLGKARASARQLKDQSILRGLVLGIELAGPELTGPGAEAAAPATRVREWFPETLLWRPALSPDEHGRATLDITLADSITNWKLRGGAITTDGRVGSIDADLTVFQPFFVEINAPVALTRADEIELPVIVYNYLDAPQRISLRLEAGGWFDALSPLDREIELAPGEVARVGFRILATTIGEQPLRVRATGQSADGTPVADAVRRTVTIEPEGEPVERVASGTLRSPAALEVTFPPDAIEGSQRLILKLYPSTFSQVLEGLDGIFQRPYGCFEQTSSTTYPNLLALDYLRRTGTNAPELEAKALQYIHLGYQRLLSFEVPGGGFDWFGNPPADVVLTAYGLMEFRDMSRVRSVDPDLIERTRAWLLTRQDTDGSWWPDQHMLNDGLGGTTAATDRLATTAYIAWAVFAGDAAAPTEAAERARAFLRATPAGAIDDPYTLALVALALHATGDRASALDYTDRLLQTARPQGDNLTAWSRPGGRRTMFYGAGGAGDVEATALAAIALMELGQAPTVTRDALAWLVERRDPRGSWGTTQATVLALRAMVMSAGRPLANEQPRTIEVHSGGTVVRRLTIEPRHADVLQLLDLTDLLDAAGPIDLSITDLSGSATGYQLAMLHHQPRPDPTSGQPLRVSLDYSATDCQVGEWISATALVENRSASPMPMVLLDLPIPAGFQTDAADWDRHAASGRIAKYELTPRSVIVYLRSVEPGRPLGLAYRLRATTPVEVEAAGATASEYYDPTVRATSAPTRLHAAGQT
ncbi:MAG: hypothetical protein IT431_13690 [Phycisphaerales bacterium]|nr:hypothetical protein [Phycisphaerales bacterium]